jgi:uncharacterized Fe-S cluster-containing radical SAM superfamily protein
MSSNLDTEKMSAHLRGRAIDLDKKSILITNFSGSEQERDLSEPANCEGFGRVRHFRLDAGKEWPQNPLPILPAAKALGIRPDSEIRAQVFQNSICNWRCWYCFVDFKLLIGDSKHASFLTCDKMLDLYLNQDNPPMMLDLTGGQPDLTPEWIPWMMEALKNRGLDDKIYLWSDDNLSNDYLWRYLSSEQIDLISSYPMYSRVCCFKGIDENSFSLNTKADPKLLSNQFELCKRLLEMKIDLYCYITLTAPTSTSFESAVPIFLDNVQRIDEMLPLRIVPLRVYDMFTPIHSRMTDEFKDMIAGQYKAIEVWNKELAARFSPEQLNLPITEVEYKK